MTIEVLVKKGVSLWCDLLRNPVFDNGGKDVSNFLANSLCADTAKRIISKMPDFEKRVELFRLILVEKLVGRMKDQRDLEGRDSSSLFVRLSSDYGPDRWLMEVAEKAHIPIELFSLKTDITITEKYVSRRVGYNAIQEYYYPYSDGWYITSLCGSIEDIKMITDYIEWGEYPQFKTEEYDT